jgi:hypothetical protein
MDDLSKHSGDLMTGHPAAIRGHPRSSLMSFVKLGSNADRALATATAEAMIAAWMNVTPSFGNAAMNSLATV